MFHTFTKGFEYIQILINIIVDYCVISIDRFLSPKIWRNSYHINGRIKVSGFEKLLFIW